MIGGHSCPRTPCDRFVADSALGTGFEPSVPPRKRRPSREAPRPTIVVSRNGLCLMTPSSLSVWHLSSATAERPFTRAGPMVRIRFPPAESPCLTQTRPLQVENRGFRAGVRRSVGGAVGRDAQAGAISRQRIAISLSGLIPVPQCRRRGLGTVTTPTHSKSG